VREKEREKVSEKERERKRVREKEREREREREREKQRDRERREPVLASFIAQLCCGCPMPCTDGLALPAQVEALGKKVPASLVRCSGCLQDVVAMQTHMDRGWASPDS
jgi:hypothetical protein